MKPYGAEFKKHFYRDEESPQTKHTGSNYRKRKLYRREEKKVTRAKLKERLRKEL